MRKEIAAFLVLGLILALVFFLPKSGWREYRSDFLKPAPADSAKKTEIEEGEVLLAAGVLREFTEHYGDGEISERLERISDSLSAVLDDLGSRRERLEAAMQRVRRDGMEIDDRFDRAFFHAARAFQELERAADNALSEIDSTRMRLLDVPGRDARTLEAARIHWNSPSRVGVREACLSCHRPLDGGRVMLIPGEKPVSYPQPMLQHQPGEFGCTVCHHGSAQALDFARAHGDDPHGRPFRPARLALRSCGLCHAAGTELQDGAISIEWPSDCTSCHTGKSFDQTTARTLFPPYGNGELPDAELRLRSWLLRHWAENTGRMPEREEFETALIALLAVDGQTGVSMTTPAADSAVRAAASIPTGVGLACPTCGRRFIASGDLSEYYCPVDGTRLEQPGIE